MYNWDTVESILSAAGENARTGQRIVYKSVGQDVLAFCLWPKSRVCQYYDKTGYWSVIPKSWEVEEERL